MDEPDSTPRPTPPSDEADALRGRIAAEESRILQEYARRLEVVEPDRYAAWDPAEAFLREGRRAAAAALLRDLGAFPLRGKACLEVGCGALGWLADLIGWGADESDLHGIELIPERRERAHGALPRADIRCGTATRLPWGDATFRLVVLSTVLSSVLDQAVRRRIAEETVRVLAPGGILLWYDFAVSNPWNPNVRGIPRREVAALFEDLTGRFRSVSLAPPLARRLVPVSRLLAGLCEALPPLRTHLVGALSKPFRGN